MSTPSRALRSIIAIVLTIASTPMAFACSCSGFDGIPEFIKSTPVIFDGVVKKTRRSKWHDSKHRKATFKITKVYKGEINDEVTISHEKDMNGNCGLDLKKNDSGVMYAYINAKGGLSTNTCSFPHGFSDTQITKFIEHGIDSSELDIYCLWDISAAYEGHANADSLSIENPRCEALIPIYDELFPKEAK